MVGIRVSRKRKENICMSARNEKKTPLGVNFDEKPSILLIYHYCYQIDPVQLQVNSKYVAEDLVADFDAGLEYAEADCLLDVQHRGDSRQYLVK